jgi:pimeloyl-ACP methyl ester carboxylesterase
VSSTAPTDTEIRPFNVSVREDELVDLRRRIAATRWPDGVLDNVTHYWLTNTGVSSARLYWESHLAFFDVKGVEIPVGVTVFPDELYPAPQSWAEQAYPRLVHYNRVEEGGHFAAWEQPQILSQELRDTFRSLR